MLLPFSITPTPLCAVLGTVGDMGTRVPVWDIARRFGVRQSTISRVLKTADDDGWLERSVVLNPSRIGKDARDRAEALLSEPDLHKHIAKRAADGRKKL